MTSAPVRDPLADHLLTPENAAFLLIDYQPAQLAAVRSMDHALLMKNAVSTVRTIKTFGVPVVHSTVNVASGQGSTLPELRRACWQRTSRSRPDHGQLLGGPRIRSGPSTPPAAASSSSAPCGPKSAWPSPHSMRCAKDTRSTPLHEHRQAVRRHLARGPPRRPGPRDAEAGGQPVSWVSLACELQRRRPGPPGTPSRRSSRSSPEPTVC